MSIKTAYFDCAFGAAGDMLVGACIDCGVSAQFVEDELHKLNLPGETFSTSAARVHRASIQATKFDVLIGERTNAKAAPSSDKQSSKHSHEHSHEHSHDHSHEHSHSHEHEHAHTEDLRHDHSHADAKAERALSDILQIINASSLEADVKEMAGDIFECLGRAESAVHGVPVESIHFHEVGAVDAICDIVGFSIAYKKLGIEQSFVSPLPLGSGTVQTMHGRFPVPGPAVLALLREAGAMTSAYALPYECLTPTGAAILCTIAKNFGATPAFERIDAVGYGAGSLNPGDHPNIVRLIVGQSAWQAETAQFQAGAYEAEVVAVIEANIDDMSPPVMAYAMEQILQAGALDVSLSPIVMKKGRLAQKLSVVARPDDRHRIISLIVAETTTIGTRSYFCERLTLSRDFQQVTIGEGPPIRIKLARDGQGRLINLQPEYEDCLAFAKSTRMPLKEVLMRALAKASDLIDSQEKS